MKDPNESSVERAMLYDYDYDTRHDYDNNTFYPFVHDTCAHTTDKHCAKCETIAKEIEATGTTTNK